jgi:hypothetical protein
MHGTTTTKIILKEVYCDFLDFTLKGNDLAPVLHKQMSHQNPQQAKNLIKYM